MLAVFLICVANCIMTVEGNTQDFTVRLNNSFDDNSTEGRLEIYYNGSWGTVCDDGFTNVSARVACASLGFRYIGAVVYNKYGAGEDPIWLDDVTCNGNESGIDQCAHSPWGQHDCVHRRDVSISCDCFDKYFSEPTGQISSPGYPMAYRNGLNCSGNIIVPPGKAVVIEFLSFDTENKYDWVTIVCEYGNSSVPHQYSGSILPEVLTISSCRLLNVRFQSDSSGTGTGFSLTYKFISELAEDTPDGLNLMAIILGAVLGAAVLTIIIIVVILLCLKCRQLDARTNAGDINNGYEHVTHPIGGSSIDGNNYDNIYNGDINGAYDKEIHQTGSKDGVGDINDGYEHVFNETEKSNGAEDGIGNNYDKIVASDTDDNYNNGIHQTVRKGGNETFSENYDTVVTPDYESLDDARPPSIFSDVCEEIIDNQK